MKFAVLRGIHMKLIQELKRVENKIEIKEQMKLIREYSLFLYIHSLQAAYLTGQLILHSEKAKVLQEAPYFEQCLMGALVHDFGKIGKPLQLIRKKTTFNKPQMAIYKKHTEDGYTRLMKNNLPLMVYHMVLKHHERLDADGFPYHLREDEIPLECRCLSVADTFLAMSYWQKDKDKEKMFYRCQEKFALALCENEGLDQVLVEDFLAMDKEIFLTALLFLAIDNE